MVFIIITNVLPLLGRHLPQRQSWHIVFGLLMLACNSGPAGCHMQARGLPFAIPRGAKWGRVLRPSQGLSKGFTTVPILSTKRLSTL